MVCFVFRAVCEPHQTVYGRSHRRGSALRPALSVISQELAAPRAERQRGPVLGLLLRPNHVFVFSEPRYTPLDGKLGWILTFMICKWLLFLLRIMTQGQAQASSVSGNEFW